MMGKKADSDMKLARDMSMVVVVVVVVVINYEVFELPPRPPALVNVHESSGKRHNLGRKSTSVGKTKTK